MEMYQNKGELPASLRSRDCLGVRFTPRIIAELDVKTSKDPWLEPTSGQITMTSAESNYRALVEAMLLNQANIDSIVHQVREARAKLGAILDRLEDNESPAVDFEGLRLCSATVADEIDQFVDKVRRS